LGPAQLPQTKPPSSGHIGADSVQAAPAKSNIPQPVQQSAALPKPKPAAKTETYSVVVKDVKVEELLFALARDAKLNVDIHPGIRGTVTLNAIDQTLPQLLNRIAKQVDMRFELDGPNLVVMPDTPLPAHLQGGLRQHVARHHRQRRHQHPDRQHQPDRRRRRHRARRRAAPAAMSPRPRWTMSPRTASGKPWNRTSRTSCARPTRKSSSSGAWPKGRNKGSGRCRCPATALPGGGGAGGTPHRSKFKLLQPQSAANPSYEGI
jgi:hypothetical protein